MNSIKYICVIILTSFCFFNKAQTLQFDNYTTKSGLISDEVYKLRQDKKGYVWMFTNYGAMKYNGKTFQSVLKNLPFNESFIYAFYENSEGKFWVANSNCKIYEVKNDSAFQVLGTEKLSDELNKLHVIISEFVIDEKDNIYVPTPSLLFKFVKKENYKSIKVGQNLKDDSIYGYLLGVEDQILLAVKDSYKFYSKINKVIDFKFEFINQMNPFQQLNSFKFKENNYSSSIPKKIKKIDNEIYFIFYFKIIKVDSLSKVKFISFKSHVLDYTKDKRGHLWVATVNNGIYELDKNDSIINHYFIDKTINHILFDSQNGLWLSTEGSGLMHCNNINQNHFTNDLSLMNGIKFMKKIDNVIFFSNYKGDIIIYDKEQYVIKSDGVSNNVVLDVFKYKEGYIVVSNLHLDYLQIKNKKARILPLPFIKPAFHPLKVFELGHDSILAMNRRYFLLLNKGLNSLPHEKTLVDVNCKLFSFKKRNSQMLFATDNGVYEYLKGVFYQPEYLKATKNCVILNIVDDAFGNLWFCSKGDGLFKLTKDNTLIKYTTENGLPSNIINSINITTDHNFLLSTNIGLFQSSIFTKWNEVYSEQVKNAFSLKNDIYILTKDGLVINKGGVIEEKRNVFFNTASVFVNTIQSNEKEILTLKHNQNNLEFNFDIITNSLNVPDIIYQLYGDKKEQGLTKNQQIIFKNIPPGSYTLEVNLAPNSINYIPITIKFNIKPAYWQTRWFLIFVFVFICILIWFVFLLFYRYKIKRENAKNQVNQMIAEYKLIALKAQINPHFMSNCLTAIQQLIYSEKLTAANQYIAKFSFLVRQVLNFSSKNLITLKEELDVTHLNVELELLRFENKFLYQVEIAPELDAQSLLVPPLILQPIIENAIWHGLLPLKKHQGILNLNVLVEDKMLVIVIKDNGVGRGYKKNVINNLKDSKGLEIIRQRILNLNTIYNLSMSDLIIEDVTSDTDESSGTRVKIILPFLKLEEYE